MDNEREKFAKTFIGILQRFDSDGSFRAAIDKANLPAEIRQHPCGQELIDAIISGFKERCSTPRELEVIINNPSATETEIALAKEALETKAVLACSMLSIMGTFSDLLEQMKSVSSKMVHAIAVFGHDKKFWSEMDERLGSDFVLELTRQLIAFSNDVRVFASGFPGEEGEDSGWSVVAASLWSILCGGAPITSIEACINLGEQLGEFREVLDRTGVEPLSNVSEEMPMLVKAMLMMSEGAAVTGNALLNRSADLASDVEEDAT